jgi:lipopolysaccharide/colanic/teichoic acid biosynthesis glycosyltransferase
MSLVAPRPQVSGEVALYRERERLRVRLGPSGLWQVSGRSGLSWKEAILLDFYYLKNWSLWLDLRILARPAGVVLSGRGTN